MKITSKDRKIEGIELLEEMKGELVEVDFYKTKKKNLSECIEELSILVLPNKIILGDFEDRLKTIHILKEEIVEIEEEYEGKVVIYLLEGQINISRI